MEEPTFELYCIRTGYLRKTFTEETAPVWLVRGVTRYSSMSNRWFWRDHVKTLKIGQFVETDFSKIVRIF